MVASDDGKGAVHSRKGAGKEKDVILADEEDQLPEYGQARRNSLLEGEIFDERYETTKRGMGLLW
jgi:hypothetical protein